MATQIQGHFGIELQGMRFGSCFCQDQILRQIEVTVLRDVRLTTGFFRQIGVQILPLHSAVCLAATADAHILGVDQNVAVYTHRIAGIVGCKVRRATCRIRQRAGEGIGTGGIGADPNGSALSQIMGAHAHSFTQP